MRKLRNLPLPLNIPSLDNMAELQLKGGYQFFTPDPGPNDLCGDNGICKGNKICFGNTICTRNEYCNNTPPPQPTDPPSTPPTKSECTCDNSNCTCSTSIGLSMLF